MVSKLVTFRCFKTARDDVRIQEIQSHVKDAIDPAQLDHS